MYKIMIDSKHGDLPVLHMQKYEYKTIINQLMDRLKL